MEWYYYIILLMIVSQMVFLISSYNNFRYAIKKYRKKRWFRPKTVLVVPCKGLESSFEKNITSFFQQQYDNYLLWFVVADESDPAYSKLCQLKEQLGKETQALDVQILVAGQSDSCSQKIHNLLYCYHKIGNDIDVLAVADSDICINSNWLSHIVYPLHKPKNGVASGYRWFIPQKNNSATLSLSALNAKVAQLLGNTRFNQVWGGSMAIRVELFRKLGIEKLWSQSLSDDLSLSRAVKKAHLKVAFVPACLVASYEQTTWPKLYEFARRQFLITRVVAPGTWWFGLFSSIYAVLGLWAGAALAAYVIAAGKSQTMGRFEFLLVLTMPIMFLLGKIYRAVIRQKMIFKLLKDERKRMKTACAVDILFSWVWSLFMLFFIISSAFGDEICWRGIRYRLHSPTKTTVLSTPS